MAIHLIGAAQENARNVATIDPTRRRQFLQQALFGVAFFSVSGAFAEELARTPAMTEGPFYPDKLPLDTDNDLLIINDSITPAVGEITHMTGRILDKSGAPIRNAFVEIWQVDNKGSYLHSRGAGENGKDSNFQGYGRFLTNAKGEYYFRTIKPVPYGTGGVFRAPHIHYGVSKNGRRIFTTQCLVKRHEANAKDGIFQAIRDPKARETVLVDFKPMEGSKTRDLVAKFDIVMGRTVEELEDGTLRGGIGKPEFRPGGGRQG